MAFSKDMWETQRKQLEKQNSGNKLPLWKPKMDGKYLIRLFLSPNDPEPVPFVLVYTHWIPHADGKKYPIICTERSELGETKPCPICKKRKELFDSGIIEKNDLARDIGPTRAYVQWGFVKEPTAEAFNPQPKLIAFPKTPVEQIVDAMTTFDEDEERPNLFDLKSGKVIILRRTTDGQYPKYTATISSKSLALNKEPFEAHVQNAKKIVDMFPNPSEEDLSSAMSAIAIAANEKVPEENTNDDDDEAIEVEDFDEETSIGSALTQMNDEN